MAVRVGDAGDHWQTVDNGEAESHLMSVGVGDAVEINHTETLRIIELELVTLRVNALGEEIPSRATVINRGITEHILRPVDILHHARAAACVCRESLKVV